MGTSLFIARRTATAGAGITGRIATAAVAVSIAVMIVTVAVISGFRREIASAVSALVSEVTVADLRSFSSPDGAPIRDSGDVRDIIRSAAEVRSISEYALRGAAIRSREGVAGAVIKGVGSDYDLSFAERAMLDGEVPQFGDERRKELLLTAPCAQTLGVGAGDRVELLLTDGERLRREMFVVCGVCDAGLGAFGSAGGGLAWTDIRNVRRMNGWDDDEITGYEAAVDDFDRSDDVATLINLLLATIYDGDDDLVAVSAREQYAYIFGWLGTHDVNAAVIIGIMLIVALFNMITATLVLVLERTRTVGILKALGMRNGAIRRIFVYRAGAIVARGLAWGNAAGIGLAALQMWTHAVPLDTQGYYVSWVPVSLSVWWIAALNIFFAAAVTAAMHIAASIIARISPADAVRYE